MRRLFLVCLLSTVAAADSLSTPRRSRSRLHAATATTTLTTPRPDWKDSWARKYCSVSGLRESFGKNRSRWGDLDAATTRRLYQSLLPVVLLEVLETGDTSPYELARLAYQARRSAKLYCRERSQLQYRVFAQAYDGLRHFQKYGTFDVKGLSYQQLWDKYSNDTPDYDVCAKIIERACVTNAQVDQLCQGDAGTQQQSLQDVDRQLEQDIRTLLSQSERHIPTFRALRAIARVKRKLAALRPPDDDDK